VHGPTRTFRSNYGFVSALRLIAIAPVVAVFGAATGEVLLGHAGGVMLAAVFGALSVLYLVLVARRLGVAATPAGLVIRNSARIRHIAWRDVDHVELLDSWPFTTSVVTVGGKRIRALGLHPLPFRASRERSHEMVRELNELRPARSDPRVTP
jgi:hypothetical protein